MSSWAPLFWLRGAVCVALVRTKPLSVVGTCRALCSGVLQEVESYNTQVFRGCHSWLPIDLWPCLVWCEHECNSSSLLGQQDSLVAIVPGPILVSILIKCHTLSPGAAAEPDASLIGVMKWWFQVCFVCVVCGFLQVVVVFCLWGTDVSRAYVFQASRSSEGGDNPPPHTKGENNLCVRFRTNKNCFLSHLKQFSMCWNKGDYTLLRPTRSFKCCKYLTRLQTIFKSRRYTCVL